MMFQSLEFLIFFAAVSLLYWILPCRLRKYWLLVASYGFYLSFTPQLIVYLLGITLCSFGMGIAVGINRKKAAGLGRWTLALGIVGTVSVLLVVKYAGFAARSINTVIGLLGIQATLPQISLMQPIGISFFTFSAIGYLVDVYRGKRQEERNIFSYALYLSFFPIILSGPVERSTNLLRQIDHPTEIRFDTYHIRRGLLTMTFGYFLKLVIADRIGIFVNEAFANVATQPGCFLALAVAGFGIQLYCDFAGISYIAIGAGEVLGFSLQKNFAQPYLAVSISDFGRRWHISLTSWFRDYIYIPLGGNRKGKARKWINTMIVFLVSGLWHGAGWTYIIWGGINGLFIVLGDMLKPVRLKLIQLLHIQPDNAGNRFFRRAFTFIMVTFAWLFFRADSFQQAMEIMHRILTQWKPWALWNGSFWQLGINGANLTVLLVSLLMLLIVSLKAEQGKDWRDLLLKQGYAARLTVYMILIFSILIFGLYGPSFDAASFIYVDF